MLALARIADGEGVGLAQWRRDRDVVVAAGGVATLAAGMQAHVGVAAVQQEGSSCGAELFIINTETEK